MYKLSKRIVLDWDDLAVLMGITKEQRDNIRFESVYIDERARAEKLLSIINCKKDFSREKLIVCLEGTGRQDLIDPIVTGAWRNGPKCRIFFYKLIKPCFSQITTSFQYLGILDIALDVFMSVYIIYMIFT